MSKKTLLVLAALGFGAHMTITTLSQFNLTLGKAGEFALYFGVPVFTSLLMLVYAGFNKVSVLKMVAFGLLLVTACFHVICVSEVIKGGVPEGLTVWKIFQFWLVNVILWSPICLTASAFLLYVSNPKSKSSPS